MSDVNSLLKTLSEAPESVQFNDVIQLIDSTYQYTPTSFQCGDARNDAGSNEGSCKILAFAKMHSLSAEHTLHLFGDFYRSDVLGNPDGTDHSNIRNFIKTGWSGVSFESDPLR